MIFKKLTLILISISFFISCKENPKAKDYLLSDSILLPKKVTNAVLASGELQRIDSFPTIFIVPRTVDIWLPEAYSKDKKYSVLYMHDGQNLFDATTTWNNQEWKVDELASELFKTDTISEFIVVGIHNIPDIRFLDYYPEKALDYLSDKVKDSLLADSKKQGSGIIFDDFKADDYLKFITQDLKPFIDSTYATLPTQENTFISGSSMGGLISMYAMCEYPEVFGGAACISTHWPGMNPTRQKNAISKSIFDYMAANLPSPDTHKFYFDYGTETLDAYYPKYLVDIDRIFESKGYTRENYMNLEFEGADHSEDSWCRRFDIPLAFLFKK
jgi:predicted alpha/beta superfamily hydrolase